MHGKVVRLDETNGKIHLSQKISNVLPESMIQEKQNAPT